VDRARLVAAFAVPALLCAAWTVIAGKDVNWDLLNYHYYVPYELLGGRLDQDFFAASAQSYLNPAGYLPFYFMLAAGWHSVLASMALAAVHGTNLAFLYLIATRLFAHRPPRERRQLAWLAAAAGAATAIFWAMVGTSFLDPITSALMLAGLLALLERPAHARCALVAGLLFGAAAALKYSNAIFALAAMPLVLARGRALAAYAAGGILSVAALAGPWFFLMAQEFGNPVFPLLNAWFGSSHAPLANLVNERFLPRDLGAVLAFPFRMIAPDRMLYAEITAPDLRFAALIAIGTALPVVARWRGLPPHAELRAADWRLLAFFAAALALWLATSANGRYGLVVLLLAGVCLARLLERLLPLSAARVALLLLLVVQGGASLMVSSSRWFIADRWSASWLPFVVPGEAVREPALYLTLEALPMSAIAPFFHPQSSFVNVRGQMSIAPDAPRLRALLERHRGRVRTLGRTLQLRNDGRPREEVVKAYDDGLLRFGYRVDAADCVSIPWVPDDGDWLSRVANRLAGEPVSRRAVLSLGSCALVEGRPDPRRIEEEIRISALFDRMEKTCPGLFRGQTAVTEPRGGEWSRSYPGLDARLETHGGRAILNRYLALAYHDLGPLRNWEQPGAPLPRACTAAR
jgi:hypothetical protein